MFIDCTPSLGPTTRAGLAASDGVLVVVELSALSFRGVDVVLSTIDELWQELNHELGVGGVIVNRAPAVSTEATRQAEELEQLVGTDVLMRPFIPQRTVINEAVGDRTPLHSLGYRARRVADVFDQLYEQVGQLD
ncbi:MAG: ParA family protein [Microthrixaceae bacterium]